jgi:hypothetical protein
LNRIWQRIGVLKVKNRRFQRNKKRNGKPLNSNCHPTLSDRRENEQQLLDLSSFLSIKARVKKNLQQSNDR